MTNLIELTAADGLNFPAYEARPAGQSKGTVVVLQEIFGVNAHIRAVVDGFAALGFGAVAPATFHRVKAGVELGYNPEDVVAGAALKAAVEALAPPGVLQDIQATIRYAAHASFTGKVGMVGYCWGGLLTWRAACLLSGLSAAEVEVHIYPAGHGFNCDHRSAYDAKAAALARERTLDFFTRHLG